MAEQALMCKRGEALELIFRVKRCSSLWWSLGQGGFGNPNALPHHPCPLDTEIFCICAHHPFYYYQWVHMVSVSDVGWLCVCYSLNLRKSLCHLDFLISIL